MSAALSDLRLIVRRLALRDRHFALLACGTMALGLASAALIFSLVNGLLLRPLPYKDPEHLVRIAASHSASRNMNRNLSQVSFEEVRAVPELSGAAAYNSRGLNVTVGTEPHRVAGATASPELFGVLDVNPLAGRVFSFEEARRGEPVAVISELLVDRAGWAVPEALGRTMTIDGQDRTVIGVMPASFRFPETTQVWIPLGPAPLTDAIEGDLAVVARLRAGGAAALQKQMQTAANAMAEAGHERGWRFHTRPLNPLRAEGRMGTQGTGSFEEIELLGATASSRTARVEQVVVSSGFFETMSLPLREGRPFRANEPSDTAIVSEAFARRYWPSAPALDQSIGVHTSEGLRVVRVIGVAGDMRNAFAGEGARRAVPPRLYLPLHFGISRGATVYARGREGSAESVAATIRAAVNASDPHQAVWATTSLVDFLAVTRLPVKWFGYLLGACSMMALLVACVGLHGVVSFSVRRRRREFAIRATFGARPGQIVGTILRDALRPSIIGLALGIAGGAVFGRAMSTLLYGVPTFDMLVTAVTAVFLLSAVVVASVVPAIRLSRLEPSRLLRAD